MNKEQSLWSNNLPLVFQTLELGNDEALVLIPAAQFTDAHHPKHAPNHGLLVHSIHSQEILLSVKNVMGNTLNADHPAILVRIDGGNQVFKDEANLDELNEMQLSAGQLWVYFPPLAETESFQGFQEIIAHLRAPEGCPWDREQTHLSLRNNLLEETYELLEAIDREDVDGMREEFGDLLLQIVLHAQIAAEAGEFRMEDVIDGISRKLIRRHPHVFGEIGSTSVKGVLQNWEKIKKDERAQNGKADKGILDGVPAGLPALTQAQELQDRAARVGFDWPSIGPVWDKVHEELEEVRLAKTPGEVEKELGDLLFAIVNIIRWNKVDAESALRGTNQKFRRRFKYIEGEARNASREMQSMTLDEMDGFWNEAKGME